MINLLHGDCLELMKLIPDKSIDAIITDPPYGTTACKWDSVIPFDLMWEQLNRIIKDNGAIVLFSSQPFTSALIMSNLKMFRYEWIWQKSRPTGFQMSNFRPMKNHETIVVFSKLPATYTKNGSMEYYPQGVENCDRIINRTNKHKTVTNGGDLGTKTHSTKKGFPKTILKIKNTNKDSKNHPTEKPVELIEYIIKTYTNENETVLDFTMGSGTTGIACKNLNRKFVGIEMDDKYFELAKNRIENHIVVKELF
jgi:site-specific DNA-methyltransferase (adenine-specific)